MPARTTNTLEKTEIQINWIHFKSRSLICSFMISAAGEKIMHSSVSPCLNKWFCGSPWEPMAYAVALDEKLKVVSD